MKKMNMTIAMLIGITPLLFAETNALITVHLFKDWVIAGEDTFGGFVFKNTGSDPLPLAQKVIDFEGYQLMQYKSEGAKRAEERFQGIEQRGGFYFLPPGETHIYEGRKFYLDNVEGKMPFTIAIYFGNGVWIETEPITLNGVVPDSEEKVTTITNAYGSFDLVTVTYKNERWLYAKYSRCCFPVCPISQGEIRIEPYDGKQLHKIWDGDKSMIYQAGSGLILEGSDENNVLGKWTRERKQKAEADNAEVRRKRAETEKEKVLLKNAEMHNP